MSLANTSEVFNVFAADGVVSNEYRVDRTTSSDHSVGRVRQVASFLMKKVEVLKHLSYAELVNLVSQSEILTLPSEQLVLLQGETGKSIYILLDGQVSVYQLSDIDEMSKFNGPVLVPKKPLRLQLGRVLSILKTGSLFGEVSLLNDGSPRAASVITDEQCELLVIGQQLFDTYLKQHIVQSYSEKERFISSTSYFNDLSSALKTTLTMVLVKQSLIHNEVVAKQGDKQTAIYFILSGEVKLTVDAEKLNSQFAESGQYRSDAGTVTSFTPRHKEASLALRQSTTRVTRQHKPDLKTVFDVALIGPNEIIGDMEALLRLDRYCYTATCTRQTVLLKLQLEHYRQLLDNKQSQKCCEALLRRLQTRLSSRLARQSLAAVKSLPMFPRLLARVEEMTQRLDLRDYMILQSSAATKYKKENDTPTGSQSDAQNRDCTLAQQYSRFIPVQGALIDQYGPGTVFHHIREVREQRNAVEEDVSSEGSSRSPSAGTAPRQITAKQRNITTATRAGPAAPITTSSSTAVTKI